MLHLSNVTLTYPDGENSTLNALDSVELTVPAGQMLALVGPSGSGKSSLLAVAGALVSPTSGTVHIGSTEITGASQAERARMRLNEIGLIFQQPQLMPSLTAVEQLQLVGVLRGHRPRAVRDAALESLAAVGMAEAARRRPHQLSGGQRQRVNIARALMGEPSVLLVDEPTSALDQHRSAEVMELLATLTRDRGTATVVVTHDLEFVAVADRAVTLRDGRLTEHATV
ncbi:ABC transporter ATP-binding protein [Citricoccus muralis]|uniref:Putative ABC transport system ATP-binding protein n=1 Tax=Citricoccus muralis TaxID=169134 RepID=A0A3D9L7L3_9MICC|nr:ABC transporter ATP-binding protein [Citricoccus muralis]REE02339.1 putative ABC transport system ATP-binding protein [Citricoccus muralis]